MVPPPVFLISGISLRSGDVDVFFLQSKVLCSWTHCLSSDHFQTDAVVPSSDHCRIETVLPLSEHYCIEPVAPSGDHYCIDIVVPSSDHCCTVTLLPSSDHCGTTKAAPPSDHLHTERTKQRKLNWRKKPFTKSWGVYGSRGPHLATPLISQYCMSNVRGLNLFILPPPH